MSRMPKTSSLDAMHSTKVTQNQFGEVAEDHPEQMTATYAISLGPAFYATSVYVLEHSASEWPMIQDSQVSNHEYDL